MKTILIDAVYAFIIETEEGFKIFEPMQKMLDEFPNRKIILTSASDEKFEKYIMGKSLFAIASPTLHSLCTHTQPTKKHFLVDLRWME